MHSISNQEKENCSRCRGCSARQSGFCANLDPASLSEFAKRSTQRKYGCGAELVAQGETGDCIGVIRSGLVKVAAVTEHGDEHLLQVLHSGQLIGVPSDGSQNFACEVATPAHVCWMPRATWDMFLQRGTEPLRAYVDTMLQQVAELQLFVTKMRGRSTVQRVALWILDQIPNSDAQHHPRIDVQLSRRDLAALLYMTVETLCRALHQLDEEKAIQLVRSDCIDVMDLAKLRERARCPERCTPFPADRVVPKAAGRGRLRTNAARERLLTIESSFAGSPARSIPER
ncbi:Nitrogen fixation regulation protein FixK (plasmid) [Paracoccaceae bacterium]|nr:Nitrogen fixation regulation protein FixK [Paracoccaceae bacterium]